MDPNISSQPVPPILPEIQTPIPQASQSTASSVTAINNKSHFSKWLVLLLIFIFPPLAWFLIWRDEHYHRWAYRLLWIYGVLGLITVAIEAVYVIPQLLLLYRNLNVPIPPNITIGIVIAVLICIAEIIFGFILRNKLNKNDASSKQFVAISFLVIIIAAAIWSAGLFAGIISPIYNLIGVIK
jgi:hypothetical protein